MFRFHAEITVNIYVWDMPSCIYGIFLFQDQWDICEQQNHQAYSVTGQSYFVC